MRAVLPGLLLVGSALAALGMTEVGLRLFARFDGELGREVAQRDPFGSKVVPDGRFGYRQRYGAVFDYDNGTRGTANALGWRGPIVQMPKPSGVVRVVLLGESTTHGWGVNDHETIDAYLRVALAERFPGRRVEVVNLAFDGYDAYQVWQRLLSDGVRLQPDALVLNVGINDVRNARFPGLGDPDPRTLLWAGETRRLRDEAARGGPTLWTRAKHYLYLARLPGVVRSRRAMRSAGPSPTEHVYLDAARNFDLNVRRIAAEAGRLGVPLLLSTPPSVLTNPGAPRHMAPRSYWVVGPAETQAYRDTLSSRLQAISRELATAGQRVAYVPHSLPPAVFLDDCHLDPTGNRLMAVDFAAALAPLLTER
jgi:lysophospholipase L1-like esterase